jgi:TetR/AcrR family transcriptional regulator
MVARREARGARRQRILEALARELETRPGTRITTARLAEVLGVSEAALYRHFPSKARMFESLIEFAEESVFGPVRRIVADEPEASECCRKVLTVLLTFSARNPGITRVLIGDALVGENERLRARVAQFFDRLETQLRQVLREADARDGAGVHALSAAPAANLMLAVAEGRMTQFVRGGFRRQPLEGWEAQWPMLAAGVFQPAQAVPA